MNLSKRKIGFFSAIALLIFILILLIVAPGSNKINSGSSFNRAPDGYAAWYNFMVDQKIPIQRWQKPLEKLTGEKSGSLLRVYGHLREWRLSGSEQEWLEKGNRLVVLGMYGSVTEATFQSQHSTDFGTVKIATRRRYSQLEYPILGDQFGAIAWEQKIGQGTLILATTPYLGANAYQDASGNYQFLAQLVSPEKQAVWIDEYIHGYKDLDTIKGEKELNLVSYWLQTPLFPILIQGLILLFVAIVAANRRFGQPLRLKTSLAENSMAYIEALAGVLQKAESTEFVMDVVGKAEQLKLQKALGLGEFPVEHQTLVEAWVQQTGQPASELQEVLRMQSQKRKIREVNLLTWLSLWQQIRQKY